MENRIDIRAALDRLGESWQFGGSVTDGTEECWRTVRWEDAREKPSWSQLVVASTPIKEEIAAEAREAFKAQRQLLVDAIRVTVGDKVFDGDEVSQGRIARAAVAMTDEETIQWVLADNTPTQCTKAELIEALRLAGEEQTRLWVMP